MLDVERWTLGVGRFRLRISRAQALDLAAYRSSTPWRRKLGAARFGICGLQSGTCLELWALNFELDQTFVSCRALRRHYTLAGDSELDFRLVRDAGGRFAGRLARDQ